MKRMKWMLVGLLAVMMLSTAFISGCGKKEEAKPAEGAKKIKVGLVFDVGGRGDKSFNDAAYAGLEKASKDFGDKIDASEKAKIEEHVAKVKKAMEGDDAGAIRSAQEELARASHKLAEAMYAKTAGQQPGAGPGAGPEVTAGGIFGLAAENIVVQHTAMFVFFGIRAELTAKGRYLDGFLAHHHMHDLETPANDA